MASSIDLNMEQSSAAATFQQHRTVSGGRDRSVSMNHSSETPPAKKHRASDDEGEATPSSVDTNGDHIHPPPAPSICVGQKASTTSPQNWKDATTIAPSGGTDADALEDQMVESSEGSAALSSSSSSSSGVSSPSSSNSASSTPSSPSSVPGKIDSGLNEESFMAWLMDQKSQGVAAGQMLDVLGLGVSEGIAVDDDELWDAIISMGVRLIQPSIAARQKLDHVNTLRDVVELLRRAKKIVVLAGAGISVSCGIPDFRSENGIYSRLAEYNLPNPQCMFDIEFFRTNPKPFFAFAKELFPKSNGFTFVPSRSHYFLKLLEEKGKLLRIYSQNIDMLEHAAGISHERSILCHGSFATATCLACKRMYPGDAIREDVMKQQVPMCRACGSEQGIVKPDIVFFGESLPRRFHDSIKADENEADLVLVMGSSLKVNPVRSIVGRIHKNTPMILINREPVGRPHKFDVELLGYSDEIVEELCRELGWEIPRPDPVLLGQSNLTVGNTLPSRTEPLSFEFLPPCRHMFNGAKATSPSSSEDEGDSSSGGSHDSSGVDPDGEDDGDRDRYARHGDLDMDDEMDDHRSGGRRGRGRGRGGGGIVIDDRTGFDDDADDHLMGSGSELLLRNSNLSNLDEDLMGAEGDEM